MQPLRSDPHERSAWQTRTLFLHSGDRLLLRRNGIGGGDGRHRVVDRRFKLDIRARSALLVQATTQTLFLSPVPAWL